MAGVFFALGATILPFPTTEHLTRQNYPRNYTDAHEDLWKVGQASSLFLLTQQ
jgi:hypothetical protein